MIISNEQLLTGQSDSHIHWLADNKGLHKEALPAWLSLEKAASKEGFSLKIASGFRDFNRQLLIWNNKFSGKSVIKDQDNKTVNIDVLPNKAIINAILLYSALPGASRHHWGTELDVYAENLLPKGQTLQLEPWEYQKGGYFYELNNWLQQEAPQHGFSFPYAEFRGGVAIEPWHLSYLPLANIYQNELNSTIIHHVISNADMLGKTEVLNQLSTIYQQYIDNLE